MAISKSKKQDIVASFDAILASGPAVAFVQFDRLTVLQSNALRRKLREAGVGYKVGKKTLIQRALATKGINGTLPELTGEVAIAYSTDALAPSREIYDFQNATKGVVTLIGGIFEGEYKDKEAIMKIATIPPLHTLRGMFVNIINSPIQRMVIALDQIAAKKA